MVAKVDIHTPTHRITHIHIHIKTVKHGGKGVSIGTREEYIVMAFELMLKNTEILLES